MVMYSTVSSLYRSAFDQLKNGKPCIMNCYNPQTGNNHFVLVIGYVKGTTRTGATLDSFIVLDLFLAIIIFLLKSSCCRKSDFLDLI